MQDKIAIWKFFLAVVGCLTIGIYTARAQDEIPISTSSSEARKIFLEGLFLNDNVRFDEARRMFLKAIEKDSKFALAYTYSFFRANSPVEGREYLKTAIQLIPDVSEGEALFIKASQARSENDPVKAIQILKELVKNYPNDKRAHIFLAGSYNAIGQDDEFISEVMKAIEIDRDFAAAYNILGYAHMARENYDQAEEAFKNYIRIVPNEANPYDSIAELYMKTGRFEESRKNFEKALELNRTFYLSQRNIGTDLVFMERYEEGREAYRKALKIAQSTPARLNVIRIIARSYLFQDDPRKAIMELDKALRVASNSDLPQQVAIIQTEKCRIYVEIGDLNKADDSLWECRRVVTNSGLPSPVKESFEKSAIYLDAMIAAKRYDHDKALQLADEYRSQINMEKDPDEMKGYYELMGHIYFANADHDMAVKYLSQASQENPYTLYFMAISESKVGNRMRAMELMSKAANWNWYNFSYSLIRSKAQKALREEMAL